MLHTTHLKFKPPGRFKEWFDEVKKNPFRKEVGSDEEEEDGGATAAALKKKKDEKK